MKKTFITILFFPLLTFAQDEQAKKFIHFLNEYNTDSLASIITEDFVLKRTFVDFKNNRYSFLTTYLSTSKAWNAKISVLKTINSSSPFQFLVKDNSDYLKYLKIKSPQWILTIETSDTKIKTVTVDTTSLSKNYFAEFEIKNKKFETWLDKKYPGDNAKLYIEPGLLTKRLMEFAKLEDSQ